MQKDPLITALLGAIALCGVAVLALGIGYHIQATRSRTLQTQLIAIQNTRMMTESLAADAVQYSRTHPAINPTLTRSGITIPPAPAR